jgi:opacity protein-like surface antigen
MARMILKPALALGVLCSLGFSVRAEEAVSSLPLFALAPPPPPTAPSPWSGLYVGSEVFGISGSGRGMKGGVGGDTNFGYTHEFNNNIVVGVEGAIGYMPSIFRYSPYRGFDVAATNVKVGYDMGQFLPYVTAGGIIAKPHTTGLGTGYTGASDAVNGLFSGSSDLKGAATVGAGFDYAVTNNLKVGFSASVIQGSRGFYGPGPIP